MTQFFACTITVDAQPDIKAGTVADAQRDMSFADQLLILPLSNIVEQFDIAFDHIVNIAPKDAGDVHIAIADLKLQCPRMEQSRRHVHFHCADAD